MNTFQIHRYNDLLTIFFIRTKTFDLNSSVLITLRRQCSYYFKKINLNFRECLSRETGKILNSLVSRNIFLVGPNFFSLVFDP